MTITVVQRELPACRFCTTPLRLTRSVAEGACCCCRSACHIPDTYVDWLSQPTDWKAS